MHSILLLLGLSGLAIAHTRFTTLHINGQSQGDGVCIRQDQDPGTTTNFVPSITGPEMACGIDGSIANPSTCSAKAGDQISLEHRMWPDASQPGAIDVSHKGNTAIYMKKISSQADDVTGGGWFKILWDGYDASSGQWGTDRMNANNGLVSTTIPNDLASGNYLIRSEVLALQELGNPQMYIGCAQIELSGSGSVNPSDTVVIPGYIDASTPAMNVNIYESFTFTEYGPKAYGSGGSQGAANTSSSIGTGNTGSPTDTGTVEAGSPSINAPTGTVTISEPSTSGVSGVSDVGHGQGSTVETGSIEGIDETNTCEDDDDDCTPGEDCDTDLSECDDYDSDSNSTNTNDHDQSPSHDHTHVPTSGGWHRWSSWNNAHSRRTRSWLRNY